MKAMAFFVWLITGIMIVCFELNTGGPTHKHVVPAGGSIWLNCPVNDTTNIMSIKYKKKTRNGSEIFLFDQQGTTEKIPTLSVQQGKPDRVRSSSWGHVRIQDAEPGDSGIYTCTVNQLSGTTLTYQQELLNVFVQVTQHAPLISINKSQVTAGSNVSFTCIIDQDDQYTSYMTTWEKLGNEQPLRAHMITENNMMMLPHVSPEDAGFYVCKINTWEGFKVSDPVKLTVLYLRVSVVKTSNPVFGHDITLVCHADGIPENDTYFTWFYTKEEHTEILNGNSFNYLMSFLTIKDFSEKDEGLYKCIASNAVFNVSDTTKLFSVHRKKSFNQNYLLIYGIPGSAVLLLAGTLVICYSLRKCKDSESGSMKQGTKHGNCRQLQSIEMKESSRHSYEYVHGRESFLSGAGYERPCQYLKPIHQPGFSNSDVKIDRLEYVRIHSVQGIGGEWSSLRSTHVLKTLSVPYFKVFLGSSYEILGVRAENEYKQLKD